MKTIETKQITSKHISQFFRTGEIKNRLKNYRVVAELAIITLVMIGLLVAVPSTRPVYCSNDDPQCEVLKERITKPRNDEDKKRRNYFCEQMKDRKCSEYENLCVEKSGDATFPITYNLSGTWICKKKCPAGGVENQAKITQDKKNALKFTNEGNQSSSGKFTATDKVEATAWNLTADIGWEVIKGEKKLKLTWSNKTEWVKE